MGAFKVSLTPCFILFAFIITGCGGGEALSTLPGEDPLVSVDIVPSFQEVEKGERVKFSLRGTRESGKDVDLSDSAEWSVDDPGVASIEEGGWVEGVSRGEAAILASYRSIPAPPARVKVCIYEMRALWVTRWNYSSPEDVAAIMEKAASARFNAVFFQVRGTADAYYHSSYEPWAQRLTGTLGQDPGWDPLQAAIDNAGARGMEVHAWINVFTFWSGTSPPAESDPLHIYLAHPDWVCVDSDGNPMGLSSSGYIFVSPGNPEAREHIRGVAGDIAERYEVDGIHLDYIRYPSSDYSYDSASLSGYEEALTADPSLSYGDFQRGNVSSMVESIYEEITSIKNEVKLTAAVAGIYEDLWGWGAVNEGYHDLYQDSVGWAQSGIIDALCPMVYWPITEDYGDYTDFSALVDFWVSNRGERHLYVGMEADYSDFSEVASEIEKTRAAGAEGNVIFCYTYMSDNDYWDDLANSVYTEGRDVPEMPWRE